ncbi:MAG: glycosyltransferase 87 family protein [Corynebacterium sp.]|nr:glycosyltransferase 87 family protein [Corynebacterium sp.]
MNPQASILDRETDRVQPALTEPAAQSFIEFLGGPMGRFAAIGRARFFTPQRTLIITALLFLGTGFFTKANCMAGQRLDWGVQLDWSGRRQYMSACYNDIVPLYSAEGLDRGEVPYFYSWVEDGIVRFMEYPVLAGVFQWINATITRNLYPLIDAAVPNHTLPEAGLYFIITALVLTAFWVASVVMVRELAGNRPWDTVLMAASPLVSVHAFTNFDTPSIALALAAMLAVKKGKVWRAGVWIGLGCAFKMWPVFLLGAYLALGIRRKRLIPWFKMLASATVAWLVVNVPLIIYAPAGWAEFFRLNQRRSWEGTTVYAMISRLTGWQGFDAPGESAILNAVTLALFVFFCVLILFVGLKSPKEPRVAELALLILVAFLMTNKVWSPQYSLWLVPLVVLAVPRWRLVWSWMIAEALVWPILMWHMLGTENRGINHELLDLIIVVRGGLLLTLTIIVTRQLWNRSVDSVAEAHGGSDPIAGPFAARSVS